MPISVPLTPTITQDGLALATSLSNSGLSLPITHIAFGTGAYSPNGTEHALQHEVQRVTIAGGGPTSANSVQVYGKTIANAGAPYWCSEIGFFSNSTLVAVFSRTSSPILYISDQIVTAVVYALGLAALPPNLVTVTVDPSASAALAALGVHVSDQNAHPQYVPRLNGVGVFDPLLNYGANAVVIGDDGRLYQSAAAGNLGNVPSLTSPAWWHPVDNRYVMRYTGIGIYDPGVTYAARAVVVGDDGNVYQSLQNANSGNTPSALGSWWAPVSTQPATQPEHVVPLWQVQTLIAQAFSAEAGKVSAFAMSSAPSGWLKANGAAVSRTAYANLFAKVGTLYGPGDGSTTFNLPDLRGEHIRGWDDGRGADPGRTIGSWQSDSLGGHTHGVNDPWHGHGVNDPSHVHGVSDPSHGHGVTDLQHSHGVNDPSHGHGVNDPSHSHGVTDPQHSHGINVAYGDGADGNINLNGGTDGTKTTAASATGIGIQAANTNVSINGSLTGIGIQGANSNVSINGSLTGIGVQGANTNVSIQGSPTGISIQWAGGSETRARNVAQLICIKY